MTDQYLILTAIVSFWSEIGRCLTVILCTDMCAHACMCVCTCMCACVHLCVCVCVHLYGGHSNTLFTCLVKWLMTAPLDSDLTVETRQSRGSPALGLQANNGVHHAYIPYSCKRRCLHHKMLASGPRPHPQVPAIVHGQPTSWDPPA